MNTGIINIQYVNPRDGRRPGTVKDQAGVSYTIPDAAYSLLAGQGGQNVTIQYFVNDRGYNVLTHLNGQELPRDQRGGAQRGGPPQQAALALPPLAAPMPSPTTPQVAMPQVTPAAPQLHHILPASDDGRGFDIFLTGVVQQAMSTGKFEARDIVPLAISARDAWGQAHGAMPAVLPAGPAPQPTVQQPMAPRPPVQPSPTVVPSVTAAEYDPLGGDIPF